MVRAGPLLGPRIDERPTFIGARRRSHFVQHTAECVDVTSVVYVSLSTRLFRTNAQRCTDKHPGASRSRTCAFCSLCNPKISIERVTHG